MGVGIGWGKGKYRRERGGSLGKGSRHGGDRGPERGSNSRQRNSRETGEAKESPLTTAEVLCPSGFMKARIPLLGFCNMGTPG